MDSMTGYGRGAARRDGREITVELKAVNHRFLDLSFRAPKNLSFLEDAFRSFLNESGVRRGHVDIFINYANHREDAQTVVLDRELLHSFRKAWHDCEDLLDFCKKPDAAEVLSMSGAYSLRQADEDAEAVTALALDVDSHLREVTAPLSGVICFSATFAPLEDMKTLLGGEEEDACFAMPSPFPPEHLLVMQESVNTRYQHREATAGRIAARIQTMIAAHPGKYIVYFPSFAYLKQVEERLGELSHQSQRPDMDEGERRDFLRPYMEGMEPVLSLCVLGGVFAEGIDLPGTALDGVMVVGVGLPQVNLFQETLRDYYETQLGRGFAYAYQIPGMQKVAQAVGRVIRTENDRGVALLMDDRYTQGAYRALCPAHWQVRRGDAKELLEKFCDNRHLSENLRC